MSDEGLRELRERDARINAFLGNVKPGDIISIRLNTTDTLTGKVYEAPDARGTSLCVWTTILRHGNGIPGGGWEPEESTLRLLGRAVSDGIRKGLEQPVPPPCANHKETQHRDRQPPWCNACGWRHGRPATPAVKVR